MKITDSRSHLTSDESEHLERLLERIEEGKVVLFAGAGMSVDSSAPSAASLAKELCTTFAPDLDPLPGLQRVADLLQSRNGIDRLDLDAWIANRLTPLQPSFQHQAVPHFAWPALFTTNYDRLIEKGYDASAQPAQRLQVVRNAFDDDFNITDPSVVSLFKLYGCISRLQDPRSPLVLSRADFHRTENARQIMLKKLNDLQRANTWLFVGYSFQDGIIENLLTELQDTIGDHMMRWSYAILPHISPYERDYLRQFKVNAIGINAGEFFQDLTKRHNLFSPPSLPAPIDNTLSTLVQAPSFSVLDNQFELVGTKPFGNATPGSFYRGNAPTWADLEARLDTRREQADLLERTASTLLRGTLVREAETSRTKAIVITGSAGSGKSTLLRRLAYDLYSSLDVSVLVARDGGTLDSRTVADASKTLGRPIVVLIDSGDVDFQRLRSFYRGLADRDVPALVVIGARTGEWITAQRRWGTFAADFTMDINERFTKDEVRALIETLALHRLAEITPITDMNYWLTRAQAADRQVLVVLLELIENGRFEEIVLSEYERIDDVLAQAAYRAVSTVYEFGVPIKRELLRRALDCDWDDFIERVLSGAANTVIIEDFESVTGRAFYRAKHPLIAGIIRRFTVNQPVKMLKHIFANIDVADRDDVAFIHTILKSDYLQEICVDHAERRALFEAAIEILPGDIVVRHQMGIYEMEDGDLEEARRIFETCLTLSPQNSAIIHSFGLLEWERAKRLSDGPLQEMLYKKALENFEKVIELDRHSEYGYHSAAALYLNRGIHELEEARRLLFAGQALEVVETGFAEIDTREIGRLSNLRGQVLEVLGQLHAAREEYIQSIEKGMATAFTYNLLARLELENSQPDKALELVTNGLSHFESDARLLSLHAELAIRRPNVGRQELIRILAPAVRANPKRLSLRFWLSVALYETGNVKEAHKNFARTRELSVGIFARGKVKKMFTDSSGQPILFEGVLQRMEKNFLRVARSDNGDGVYFNLERALGSGLRHGSRVSFEIGFSYLGTIALNLRQI